MVEDVDAVGDVVDGDVEDEGAVEDVHPPTDAYKCPLWMSSTQGGRLETSWAEGVVTGGLWTALATASAILWA